MQWGADQTKSPARKREEEKNPESSIRQRKNQRTEEQVENEIEQHRPKRARKGTKDG